MTDYLLIAGFFGFGYFFQSLFGFGAAFIIILGLSLFIPIQPVIGMIPLSLLAAAMYMVAADRYHVRWKVIMRSFLISLPGAAAGALLLSRIPSRTVVISVCLVILAYSIYSLAVEEVVVPRRLMTPCLLLSGFVIGTTGLGIIFVPIIMQQIDEPAELRVSLNLMWLYQGLLRLPIYLYNGVISGPYVVMGLAVIPVLILSQYLGRRVYKGIHPEQFNRLARSFLMLLVSARLASELL